MKRIHQHTRFAKNILFCRLFIGFFFYLYRFFLFRFSYSYFRYTHSHSFAQEITKKKILFLLLSIQLCFIPYLEKQKLFFSFLFTLFPEHAQYFLMNCSIMRLSVFFFSSFSACCWSQVTTILDLCSKTDRGTTDETHHVTVMSEIQLIRCSFVFRPLLFEMQAQTMFV